MRTVTSRILGAFVACLLSATASAYDSFVIDDIQAVGLQRLELGTILTYLPVTAGDELNARTGQQSIRALYQTGLFESVALGREGDTLLVRVEERPAIASFEIEGNKKIKGEEVDEAMESAGLKEGELFRRVILDQVQQELTRQYYANGYYDVKVETEVKEISDNRVSIFVEVTEGRVAKIEQINIVGNEAFSDEELLDVFKLEPSKVYKFFQRSDRYSKQQLLGDLESLSSYYLDRGYLTFNVDSVQVALTPDKRDIYVSINVSEGETYTVSSLELAGELILNEDLLRRLVLLEAGDTFSRKEATEGAERISDALSNFGYAFADVRPLPEIDEDERTVKVTMYVEPGSRVYVRRINFSGNLKTQDETLRREMRQFEGAVFSRAAVERSRVRLARLAFVEDATVDTQPVPGTEDLVDVNFEIVERPPGSVQLGVGFSGSQGFLLTGSVTHSNFLGTGNRVSASVESNEFSRSISGSWTNPYATPEGISRTVDLRYRESEQVVRFSSGFDTNTATASLTYGFPLSEYTSIRLGGGLEAVTIETFANQNITSNEVLEFVIAEGTKFYNFELRTGIIRDTRNRTIFATRGALHRLTMDLTIPGSDLQVFKAFYNFQQYVPIYKGLFGEINASVGWADGYGDTELIPPYERLFAGGSRSVRGYRDGTLGPRDTPSNRFNNPFGGKFRIYAQNELIIPTPLETDNKSTRLSVFYDVGNVFNEVNDFETSELRSSYGVAYTWFTPFLGVLDLSYAIPIGPEPEDETDRFQLTFGTGF
ncbi:outer membrane protein assembly factor BamA [uncultured Abyssibacter sp.]|uniref:outer membrane protein assembly factor BamA n=1 Tax=uncultured Abyssibacter sp. TaxID=2320202 RepID=UPI0032B21852